MPSTGKIDYFEFDGKEVTNWNHRRRNEIPRDVMNNRMDSNIVTGDRIT